MKGIAERAALAVIRAELALRSILRARPPTPNERGATAYEYALIVGIIAVVVAGAIALLAGRIADSLNNAAGQLR